MTAVATVIGVTSRAAFLGESVGDVVALHAASVPAFPFSWIAPGWMTLALRAGDEISVTGDGIEHAGLTVPFRRLAPVTIAPDPAGLRRLARTLAGVQVPDVVRDALDDLARALTLADEDRLHAALYRVIGRGPGLTPTGDDVIVGALAGFALAGPRPEALRLRRSLQAMAPGLSHRTTRVSGAILCAAEDGRFAPVLADVCSAASSPSGAALQAALARLARIGSSTGHDLISGLALAAVIAASDAGVTT